MPGYGNEYTITYSIETKQFYVCISFFDLLFYCKFSLLTSNRPHNQPNFATD